MVGAIIVNLTTPPRISEIYEQLTGVNLLLMLLLLLLVVFFLKSCGAVGNLLLLLSVFFCLYAC